MTNKQKFLAGYHYKVATLKAGHHPVHFFYDPVKNEICSDINGHIATVTILKILFPDPVETLADELFENYLFINPLTKTENDN